MTPGVGKALRWLLSILAPVVLLSAVTAGAGAPASDEAARGEQLFQANCAMCHGADARGMMGMHPALTGVIDRLTQEGVAVTIRNGRDTRPPMPAFEGRLSDGDIDAVIAYLATLPDGPRNFGPEGTGGGMGGMGEMMPMMGGWGPGLVVVLLLVVLAGAVGYLLGVRRREAG